MVFAIMGLSFALVLRRIEECSHFSSKMFTLIAWFILTTMMRDSYAGQKQIAWSWYYYYFFILIATTLYYTSLVIIQQWHGKLRFNKPLLRSALFYTVVVMSTILFLIKLFME